MKYYVINCLSWLLFQIYRLWCKSLRYTEINRQPMDEVVHSGQSVVICLWHDELFALSYFKRDLPIIAIVSQSKDGNILAKLLERLGVETARGSSSRGGVKALLYMAKQMQQTKVNACITVDGPRGPRHESKEGAVFLALKTGAPIVAVRLVMSHKKMFRSWDRFQLPWPGSRVQLRCSNPYHPQASLDNAQSLKQAAQDLTLKLNQLV